MVNRKVILSAMECLDLMKNIEARLDTIKGEDDIFELLKIVSKINGSAYKGYGKLSDEQFVYNRKVYEFKNRIIPILFSKLSELKAQISYDGDVLYYRHTTGLQLSYHIPSSLLRDIDIPNNQTWDGVINSWEYTAEEYAAMKNSLADKYLKEKEVYEKYFYLIQKSFLRVLRNRKRRENLHIYENLDEIRASLLTPEYDISRTVFGLRCWSIKEILKISSLYLCERADTSISWYISEDLGFSTLRQMLDTIEEEKIKAAGAAQ